MKRAEFLVIVMFVVSCSSSNNKPLTPSPSVSPAPSGPKMVPITAASGGTVAANGAMLVVPPGALAADTTITASTSTPAATTPDAANLGPQQFDFGPSGTMFKMPAILSLPLTGAVLPGRVAVVAYLDPTTKTLVDLPSSVASGLVSAPVTHFTSFFIHFIVGGGAFNCAGDTFTACGGDLTGKWKIVGGCGLPADAMTNVPPPCATATTTELISYNGSVAFNADMTYDVTLNELQTYTLLMPASCLAADAGTLGAGAKSCADVSVALNEGPAAMSPSNNPQATQWTCTGDVTQSCSCINMMSKAVDSELGTYSITGNTFKTVRTNDTSGKAIPYCVTSNMLKAQLDPQMGSYIILQKL